MISPASPLRSRLGSERARVVVIGGGVIGCAILYEFARLGIEGLLVEAEPDICEGTSKANSAILHGGFDSIPGSIESRMLRHAADLWPELLDALEVPHLAVGALMLARTDEEARRLTSEIAVNAEALGVETELLDRAAVRDIAPYVADDVVAALSIPEEGVLDPFWLTRAYAEAATAGGSQLRLGVAVTGLEIGPDEAVVRLEDGSTIIADQVIDAAGLRADDVAGLAGDASFTITPRKGQFLVSEETFGVDRIVLPIPGPMGKGMLVTPIVFGGLLLGPTAVAVSDKDDRATDAADRERILAACSAMVPALADAAPVRQFAGLRHVSSTGDFILRPSTVGDRLYLAAGIRSTGISASPAVAEAVVSDVMVRRGWTGAGRPLSPPPFELSERSGEVVCLCRSIGRAEIEAACRRPSRPTTLDAVKRRGGAMFGDCQGNMCALDVARIVAAERGQQVTDIQKHRSGSWLWQTVDGAEPAAKARPSVRGGPPADRWDVIVVGLGRSGRAAARAAANQGRSVLGIERSDELEPTTTDGDGRSPESVAMLYVATVVGVSPFDNDWLVLAQTADATHELQARSVVVATGGFVQPREHRSIAGPRPAGIMTGDLCREVLASGLRPGRQVALLGASGRTDALGQALQDVGAMVIRLAAAPDEVRGEIRMEAVRVGAEWIEADTLVLDDVLLPQTFLLRPLGLADGRPGTPAPVDADGRLPLAGLWAVGCCVRADIDHIDCARDGRLVGARAASEVPQTSDVSVGRP